MKLCFDCDDTLYDLQWPFKKCVQQFFPDFYGDIDEFYRLYREYGDSVFDLLQDQTITVDDSGIYRIYKACQALGLPFDLEQAADFQDAYSYNQKHICMSDAYHTFFKATSHELAILTNGFGAHQRMKLDVLHVSDYIPLDHQFISGLIGVAKPDPRAFAYVAASTHTCIADWYYIGDSYVNDMQGAKQAGMHTIHFNRHHHQEGPSSDCVVYSENELIAVLKELEKENELMF